MPRPPTKRPARLMLQAVLRHGLLFLVLQAVLCANAHGDDLLQELHARVYVADLPSKYNLHILASEGCEEGRVLKKMLANPLGPLLEGSLDKALYRETPYYSLELYLHLQLLTSPLRVLTAEEADIVYVPFYGTQLWADLASGKQIGSTNRSSCQPNWTWADQDQLIAQFWADAPTLLPLLGSKPHWMGLSDIEWMMHRGCGEDWGIPLMCHPLAEQVTFTTPEALTEQHPTAHWRTHFYGRAPANNNSIPVPYQGHIHRVSIRARDKRLADQAVATNKALLASLSFRDVRDGSELRVALAKECRAAPGECWFLPFTSFAEVLDMYRAAWFCAQPHGDTPTRSALLDCLASGLAVPAVFDEYLFDMLPFADVLDYRSMLVYVPEENVTGAGGGLLQSLRAYNIETRTAMLESVQRAAHAFEYAVQPNHVLVRYDSLHIVHPLDDAFTMSFKAVLRQACQHGHTHSRCHHFRHRKG